MTDPNHPPVPPYGALPPYGSAQAHGSAPQPYGTAPQPFAAPQPPAAPPLPAPGQAAPGQQVPGYQAPPGAYGVPVGGYQMPVGAYEVPASAPRAPSTMGVIALLAAILAAVVAPALGAVFAYQIGMLAPAVGLDDAGAGDLAFLTPARTQVLWAEIAFWSGTALGLFAIVFGITATAKRRGRAQGITAMVIAAVAPALFFGAIFVGLGIGAATAVTPSL